MAKMSPMQRSLAFLREEGYHCEIVEFRGYAKFGWGKTHDLWGFADILAIRENEILAVQVTSRSNVAARVKKITVDCETTLEIVRKSGCRVVVHGWGKLVKTGWTLKEVDLS